MGEVNAVQGVSLTPLKIITQKNGRVLHGMRASEPTFCGFGEAYFSSVGDGAVKGWKRHRKMVLNLVVPVGSVRFVLFDDRQGSASCGEQAQFTLGPEINYARLTIPPGIWFAFQGRSPGINLLLNVANLEHSTEEVDVQPLDAIPFAWTP